jgi:hypothetical protein
LRDRVLEGSKNTKCGCEETEWLALDGCWSFDYTHEVSGSIQGHTFLKTRRKKVSSDVLVAESVNAID